MAKYVRFEVAGRVGYGVVEGNTIKEVDGAYLERLGVTSETLRPDDLRLLSPWGPSKVISVGFHADTLEQSGLALPDVPDLLLMKLSVQAMEPVDVVVYVQMSRAELAAGQEPGPQEYAQGAIYLSDVATLDMSEADAAWMRWRRLDTFRAVGPWTVDSAGGLALSEPEIDDETSGRSDASPLAVDLGDLLRFVPQEMTLGAEDLPTLRTSAGLGPVQVGDGLKVVVYNIGHLPKSVKR